jgi:PEGA domain-containing protein
MRSEHASGRACGIALMIVFSFASMAANAEEQAVDPKSAARDLVARANRAFKRARYEEAAELFLAASRVIEANRLTPKPELFYNAGLAFERLDRCDRVAELFERFLAAKPDRASPDLEDRLERAKACAPEVEVTTDPGGAKVVIDGEERGTSPLRVHVKAGEHGLHLALEGYAPIDESLFVAEGKAKSIVKRLEGSGVVASRSKTPEIPAPGAEPKPVGLTPEKERSESPVPGPVVESEPVSGPGHGVSAPVTAEPEGSPARTWAWVAGGVGLAAIGTGVVLAVLSESAISRRDAELARGPSDARDQVVRDEQNNALSLAIARDIAIGAGAGALVTSAVLFFVASKSESDSGRLGVAPLPGGGRVTWTVDW